MKILLTGGGSGGHFYPLIAVAQQINALIKEKKLLPAQLYFMSDSPYDSEALVQNNISFIKVSAGKRRTYFSILNFLDLFKTAWGVLSAFIKLFNLFPDVIFSKGGYASFPILYSAKILKIPVVIHESDSTPGRTNKWAGKFAKRIAVSYSDAALHFPAGKVAVTGNPVRNEIASPSPKEDAKRYLNLDNGLKTILVLGGSLGAQFINEQVVETLPLLVGKYNILHQTGKQNIDEIRKLAEIVLQDNPDKANYRPYDYMNDLVLSMAAGASDLVISRAGSTIFEIASWNIPSIIIPITESNGDHQRKNAYSYARSGGAIVIEESNMSSNILTSEINRLLSDESLLEQMKVGAKSFVRADAARLIANEVLDIGLKHEK